MSPVYRYIVCMFNTCNTFKHIMFGKGLYFMSIRQTYKKIAITSTMSFCMFGSFLNIFEYVINAI